MASAARDMRYRGKQAVNGSLAYDLDYAVRERALRHAGEAPKAREKAKVYEAPRVLLRARQVVSPLAVLSVAAIMGLALLVLMSYVQLTMLSADTVKLQSQLHADEPAGPVGGGFRRGLPAEGAGAVQPHPLIPSRRGLRRGGIF